MASPAKKTKAKTAPSKTAATKSPAVKKPAAKVAAKKAASKAASKAPSKAAAVKKPAAAKVAVKKPAAKAASKPAAKAVTKPAEDAKIVQQHYLILKALDDGKAEDILDFDLRGRSSLADYLIIASGRSTRQVSSLAENISKALKQAGHKIFHREGEGSNDWVVVDTGDIIVHLFRPEVRGYYRLEELWQK